MCMHNIHTVIHTYGKYSAFVSMFYTVGLLRFRPDSDQSLTRHKTKQIAFYVACHEAERLHYFADEACWLLDGFQMKQTELVRVLSDMDFHLTEPVGD